MCIRDRVKAANSSGKPSLGVGQGNCQVVIDKGMQDYFDSLAEGAIENRIWDSGIPCTGEQTVIMPEEDAEAIVAAFVKHGAMVIKEEETVAKLRNLLFEEKGGSYRANPDYVGQSVQTIGKAIGLDVPADCLLYTSGQRSFLRRQKRFRPPGQWSLEWWNISCHRIN